MRERSRGHKRLENTESGMTGEDDFKWDSEMRPENWEETSTSCPESWKGGVYCEGSEKPWNQSWCRAGRGPTCSHSSGDAEQLETKQQQNHLEPRVVVKVGASVYFHSWIRHKWAKKPTGHFPSLLSYCTWKEMEFKYLTRSKPGYFKVSKFRQKHKRVLKFKRTLRENNGETGQAGWLRSWCLSTGLTWTHSWHLPAQGPQWSGRLHSSGWVPP